MCIRDRELAKASASECATLCGNGRAALRFSRDAGNTEIADKSAPTDATVARMQSGEIAAPESRIASGLQSPIVLDLGQADTRLVARLSGDTHLLLEIGQPELDLVLRFRGHALMLSLIHI